MLLAMRNKAEEKISMKSFCCLTGSLILAASLSLQAQTVEKIDSVLKTRVDRIAAQVLEQTGVPSASMAVVKDGKLIYTHAYGMASLAPSKAATPEMRYSIGSISKQFTAAALLLLQEEGKVKMDDPVG